MRETGTIKKILGDIGARMGTRLFRNNTFLGWAGKVTHVSADTVVINSAHPVKGGLCNGSSDLIGWHSVQVTPAMVGKKVAIFLALEAKTPIGRATNEQLAFNKAVTNAGGIAGIVRSVEDVDELLKSYDTSK